MLDFGLQTFAIRCVQNLCVEGIIVVELLIDYRIDLIVKSELCCGRSEVRPEHALEIRLDDFT